MIEIKNKKKFNDISLDNFYVIADFDKTLTSKDSNTTFSLFSKSSFYPKEYLEERNRNYEYYRPLELDPKINDEEKIQIVKKWQESSYKLMIKYKVKQSDIFKILENKNALLLRKGAKEFINSLNQNNIPLIISSAGIGNFIVELLKIHNCYTNNVYVHSNMLEFNNDVVIDSIDKIIHSMNKNNITLPKEFQKKIENKKNAIIIGDQLSDLQMANFLPKIDTLSFGFLESNVEENRKLFMEKFDVVLTENQGFEEIQNLLNLN